MSEHPDWKDRVSDLRPATAEQIKRLAAEAQKAEIERLFARMWESVSWSAKPN